MKIGWAIGKGETYSDLSYQNKVEAEALYDLLERDVVPTFYDRGADRIPRKWVERMKACVDSLCHFVNTHRMVRDYFEEYYKNAHARFRALDANNAQRARELANALERIRGAWHEVSVESVEDGPSNSVGVGSSMPVRARVHLGHLSPQDVVVELYVGSVDVNGELGNGEAVVMEPQGQRNDDTYNYMVTTSIARSGLHGFTVRVRPYHPEMSVKFVPGLICWARQSGVAATVAM